MNRVIVYIDGFNLYFGMRSKGWRKYYWLDLVALSRSLLKPDQSLMAVHYFTARIRSNQNNASDIQRQTNYLEALTSNPMIQMHYGHYLEKPKTCRKCGASWLDYEEKMTDVNIAVQLLGDAVDDNFDTALLISGDSDLTEPVSWLRSRFPSKRIIIAFPPARHSNQLTKTAHATFTIGESKLRHSQLPDSVLREDGFVLERPIHWR